MKNPTGSALTALVCYRSPLELITKFRTNGEVDKNDNRTDDRDKGRRRKARNELQLTQAGRREVNEADARTTGSAKTCALARTADIPDAVTLINQPASANTQRRRRQAISYKFWNHGRRAEELEQICRSSLVAGDGWSSRQHEAPARRPPLSALIRKVAMFRLDTQQLMAGREGSAT